MIVLDSTRNWEVTQLTPSAIISSKRSAENSPENDKKAAGSKWSTTSKVLPIDYLNRQVEERMLMSVKDLARQEERHLQKYIESFDELNESSG